MLTRRWMAAAIAVTLSAGLCTTASAVVKAPNIIYFLVDDMSAELLSHTDTIAGLADGGTTFTNYYVSNSLCCPSRASMFTGRHPHNTGVQTNVGTDRGGYKAFKPLEDTAYAPALQRLDYRTGYLGKYINEYPVVPNYHVPPGWDEWHVAAGGGYNEFQYQLTRYIPALGTGKQLTGSTGEYLVDELGDRAVGFLQRSREHAPNKPFFLQVAPFSPHSRVGGDPQEPRFPPAMRDRPGGEFPHGDCGGPDCRTIDVATALPAFDEEDVSDKPAWVRQHPQIRDDPKLLAELRTDFRNRIRMMQSLDDMVRQVLTALTPAEKRDTYVVFSSDNGFHLGQHRLPRGKTTAYDHDVRVPLLVKRPEPTQSNVVSGRIAQNVDLFATFVDIANGDRPGPADRDGRSLLPLINGQQPTDWRNAALVEHVRPNPNAPGEPDPDAEAAAAGPPDYRALRTATELYVEYPGDIEFYDTRTDANQEVNRRNHPRVAELAGPLARLANCGQAGAPDCWTAAHLN